MRRRDFAALVESGLLEAVERIVVAAHREAAESRGRRWTAPDAYRWLRYEDEDPVTRLARGVERLRRRGVKFDPEAVDKACIEASKAGFSS